MSKAEKTRAFIIERSAKIFNMKGYAGTSLSDIIEATGLTKGSIYGNFENKDEVAVAVYKYNISMLNQRLMESISDKQSALEKLAAFTEHYRNGWENIFERGGCPIQNASIEADDNLSILKAHVQRSIKGWAKLITDIIEEGQATGEFKRGIDTEEYAYTIIALLEGGIMLAKIMNNRQLLFSALDRIMRIVNTEIKV